MNEWREARGQQRGKGLRSSRRQGGQEGPLRRGGVGITVHTGTPTRSERLVIEGGKHRGARQHWIPTLLCLVGLCVLICRGEQIAPGKVFVGIKQAYDTGSLLSGAYFRGLACLLSPQAWKQGRLLSLLFRCRSQGQRG